MSIINNKKINPSYIIIGLAIAFVIGQISYGFIPTKAIFTNSKIQFSGMYGFELTISEISDVKIVDNIPVIRMRTNGFSFGSVKKGFFNLDQFGSARLMIHSDSSPFLIISKKNGEITIINFNNKTETENLYKKVKALKSTVA